MKQAKRLINLFGILGGCFVEGEWLSNAFRWKETVGAWEERPGHFGDVWNYWTDDGLGHFEFFQVSRHSFFFDIIRNVTISKF